MTNVLQPIYKKIGGFNVPEGKSGKLDAVKHQVLVNTWACCFGVADCESDAISLFNLYQKNPDNKHMYFY